MEDRKITISGSEFTIPQPFSTGYVCTEGDAKALNQTFAEAIRNNMAGKVKKGEADQDAVAKYAAEFKFTLASASTAARYTPEEKEARSLAKQAISQKLDGEGRKIKDIDPEALEAAIASVAAYPQIVEQAAKIVAERKASKIELGDLQLPAAEPEQDEEAAVDTDNGEPNTSNQPEPAAP